ncbi:hypothetical protein BSY238_2112 [Methyloversatilis sp. RAC08]|nr:hypothetical protein BSY238_2112 [Methyloversatilis sp. RAC08]
MLGIAALTPTYGLDSAKCKVGWGERSDAQHHGHGKTHET